MKLIYDEKFNLIINLEQISIVRYVDNKYWGNSRSYWEVATADGNSFEISKETYEKIKEMVE